MGPILGCLNITALTLCAYLMFKAKYKPAEEEEDPYLTEEVLSKTEHCEYYLINSFICMSIFY